MKRWMRLTVTALLSALLLIYVVDLRAVAGTLARCDPLWTLAAFGVFTLDRVLMSFKWGLLLAIRNYSVTLAQRLMIYCSSMMWGLALPSTVGADGIRVLLAQRFAVRANDCIATILVERGVGFVSALLTAVMSLAILGMLVPQFQEYDQALLAAVVGLGIAIAGLVFSFSSKAMSSVLRVLPRRIALSRAAQLLERLHEAYRSLAGDRARLALFCVLTLLEQLLMIACYGFVAKALQLEIDMLFLFAAVPLAILVSRLPISIDGLGVYEGIFIGIMTLSGMRPDDSLAISLAARALQIMVWLPWWLMLMARTGTLRPPAAQPLPAGSSQGAMSNPLPPRPRY